jgi:hypothetical protein
VSRRSPPPRRHQLCSWHLELFGRLLDSRSFVGGLHGAERPELGGSFENIPAQWRLGRFGLLCHSPASIGREVSRFNRLKGERPDYGLDGWGRTVLMESERLRRACLGHVQKVLENVDTHVATTGCAADDLNQRKMEMGWGTREHCAQ